MEIPASQILEEAAELIAETGLAKFAIFKRDANGNKTSYCSVGAIDEVCQRRISRENWQEAYLSASHPLKERVRSYLPTWNNAPERTQQEVLDTFMSVAKQLRNEGR